MIQAHFTEDEAFLWKVRRNGSNTDEYYMTKSRNFPSNTSEPALHVEYRTDIEDGENPEPQSGWVTVLPMTGLWSGGEDAGGAFSGITIVCGETTSEVAYNKRYMWRETGFYDLDPDFRDMYIYRPYKVVLTDSMNVPFREMFWEEVASAEAAAETKKDDCEVVIFVGPQPYGHRDGDPYVSLDVDPRDRTDWYARFTVPWTTCKFSMDLIQFNPDYQGEVPGYDFFTGDVDESFIGGTIAAVIVPAQFNPNHL